MHSSDTWPMDVLNRTEMSTIRWMCGVKLNERKKNKELKRTLKFGTSQFDDLKE